MPRLHKVSGPGGRIVFARTHDDARRIGPSQPVDVPVEKGKLLDFINELLAEERGGAPPAEAAPAPDQDAGADAPPAVGVDALEAAILESDGPEFARLAMAAVERLGELGRNGRVYIEGFVQRQPHGAAFDRGAHLFAILALNEVSFNANAGRRP